MSEWLSRYHDVLARSQPWRWRGRIVQSLGLTIESAGPVAGVGDCCEIEDSHGLSHAAEVIGFRGTNVLSMPLVKADGVRFGDRLTALGERPHIAVGDGVIGRVLDAQGLPLKGGKVACPTVRCALNTAPCNPLERMPIRTPLGTGVRTIDALLTVGRGQRVGIFGGSGVGKSTLIGMMTRNTEADVTVIALVGERGREVPDFIENSLGSGGLARSVLVVSTSDQSPLLRMRAALAATTIAEYFAREGKDVLLVLDSLTRFAMAAREVGLAAGEPPTAKGYTPSVFDRLAKLVERAGRFARGSITAFYTVLMEGDDQQDTLVDAVRSLLDGHIVLSRDLASEGQYPPIEVLDSLSRLMPTIVEEDHRKDAALFRTLRAAYANSEDLVRIGAYKAGSDPELDRALAARPAMKAFMMQASGERVSYRDSVAAVHALAREIRFEQG
ncbi:FliI/YscN family ATPase [Occallatibacter savannae]|uniref:FliI/YscN family ATPase n=1 Tax=Occallatibacter savannae TaxID=1002691 RepID=UPI000D68CBD8|nr:FliI/YscN family ATPase [Occallatibacter savannae]